MIDNVPSSSGVEEKSNYLSTDCCLAPFDGQLLILSEFGKPIFSSGGNEEELCGVFALISVIVRRFHSLAYGDEGGGGESQKDSLLGIQTPSKHFQFLYRSPLILCLISKQPWNLPIQLDAVYNQIISMFSRQMLKGYYAKRGFNFDIRALFDGIDKRIDACAKGFNEDPVVLYAINELCPNIVAFGLLIAHRQLVALVRMKKLNLDAPDFNTIVNLIECHKTNLMQGDHQVPICLPKFNPNSFLHAYISHLWDGTGPCMVLLSVAKDATQQLAKVRPKLDDALGSYKRCTILKEALHQPEGFTLKNSHCGPQLWHFLYKNTSNAQDPTQVCCSTPKKPFISRAELTILYNGYAKLADLLRKGRGGIKTLFLMLDRYSLFAWMTPGFELFCTFNPLVSKKDVMEAAERLLRLLRKEEKRVLFSSNPSILSG
uniref:Vacuolar fusion protein MON1 homolog n=1 Tax=Globodera pallida TaxID=36090 RepID=A0A183CEJ4_GLOPA